MEDNNLDMGLFDNLEINFDNDYSIEPSYDDNDNENEVIDDGQELDDIQAIEDENQEEVDSEADDLDEGDEASEVDDSSSNLFSSVAKVLHEQGLLPSLDIANLKIENVDDFTSALKSEIEVQSDLKLQKYIDNIDVNNIAQSRKNISDLNGVTEDFLKDNIDIAKQLIYQDYLNQGLDEKKADRLLKRLIDLGDDAILEDSTEALSSLKEFEQRNIAKEQEQYKQKVAKDKLDQEQLELNLKKVIFDRNDLIDGFKPTKALQDKVYKTINDIVGKSPEGNFENKFMKDRRLSPLEFDTRMYYFYEMTNGFTDYSKLTTSAKSSAVKDLEKIAKRTLVKDNGTPSWMQDSNSYDNFSGHTLNI